MVRRAPLTSVLLALAFLLLASFSPADGQNANQDPTKPAGTTTPSSSAPGRNPNAPTSTVPGRTTNPSNGGSPPGRVSTGNPGHVSSGGSNTGAIVGGAVGAAAAGVALFELLHHAHTPDSGQTVQRLSLTLRYPQDWQLNPRLNQQDDPISFNNFNSSYTQGGVIPMGGADIDVARFPNADRSISEVISSELSDADEKTVDKHSYRIDGQQGTRVFYTDVYAPRFSYKNVAIYLARQDGLYKFFLTYHEGDPHEKSFNDDFEQILKSVRFQR